ncbi:MAG: PIN domain-containing protein [Pirellulales bacterium]
MSTVFLDTVGLLALWDSSDQWHGAADVVFRQLLVQRYHCVTTSFVLLECGNAAARYSYRTDVYDLRQEMEAHGNIVVPGEDDQRSAWEAYHRGDAAQAGIVDLVSFVVMRRLGITDAFTNDSHFRAAGFVTLF